MVSTAVNSLEGLKQTNINPTSPSSAKVSTAVNSLEGLKHGRVRTILFSPFG